MKKRINFKEIFPNFITLLGLCLGVSSIKFAFELNFEKSIYCIVLAAILDTIDGRIARFLKSTSKFGFDQVCPESINGLKLFKEDGLFFQFSTCR